MPQSASRLRLNPRQLIIPLSLGLLMVLTYAVKAPFWIVLIAALIVPASMGAVTWYVYKNLPPFEMEFNRIVPSRDTDALWKLYNESRLLLRLAPAWIRLVKQGIIFELEGNFQQANNLLEEAWISAPKAARANLLGPLARTKYALGDMESLRELATQWRARALFPGTPSLYLAASIIGDPRENADDARSLLDEAAAGLSPSDKALRAELEEALARRGG